MIVQSIKINQHRKNYLQGEQILQEKLANEITSISFCQKKCFYYRCYMCNMERIGHAASEDMSSENVDGQMDGHRVRWTDTMSH